MRHFDLRRRGPKGMRDAEWECLDCGKKGTLEELNLNRDCSGPKKTNEQRILDAVKGID